MSASSFTVVLGFESCLIAELLCGPKALIGETILIEKKYIYIYPWDDGVT